MDSFIYSDGIGNRQCIIAALIAVTVTLVNPFPILSEIENQQSEQRDYR